MVLQSANQAFSLSATLVSTVKTTERRSNRCRSWRTSQHLHLSSSHRAFGDEERRTHLKTSLPWTTNRDQNHCRQCPHLPYSQSLVYFQKPFFRPACGTVNIRQLKKTFCLVTFGQCEIKQPSEEEKNSMRKKSRGTSDGWLVCLCPHSRFTSHLCV